MVILYFIEVITMSKKRYSYSKLTTFRQCEFQYLSSYELRQESDENIYGLAGTTVHNIVEDIQEKKITNEEGLMRFDEEITKSIYHQLHWISDIHSSNQCCDAVCYV